MGAGLIDRLGSSATANDCRGALASEDAPAVGNRPAAAATWHAGHGDRCELLTMRIHPLKPPIYCSTRIGSNSDTRSKLTHRGNVSRPGDGSTGVGVGAWLGSLAGRT